MKSRTTAALLAFFSGGLGIHKFYLGQSTAGIFYLLFCWTFIPSIIAFIEFIILPDNVCNEKYNAKVNNNIRTTPIDNATIDITERLSKLHDLKEKGAITQEEYDAQKKILL